MAKTTRRWLRIAAFFMGVLCLLLLGTSVWFFFRTKIDPPSPGKSPEAVMTVENPGKDFYRMGQNWLRKSSSGLWEMYVEGTPYERGLISGKLSSHLIETQEEAFISRIREMIPSDFYLRFLKYFIYWFNRDLDKHIPAEYLMEIYGVSKSASDRFSFIGPAYQRMLNYHSAHDIGHALQDYNLVGCTSFGVWGENSTDRSLLIGRNFDFYVGDEFSREKIVCFMKPDMGFGFMMVTWGGMIGVVSGMNEAGLTVTINAAKSDLPSGARTPISILAREILQYASDIKEAYLIAGKRETFVSESILIGSARDKKAVIIEKSPARMALVEPVSDYITCANHFQSATFANDPLNRKDMSENASVYRNKRLIQNLTNQRPLDPGSVARILRDRQGLNGADIGMGNEKAMNQLIAHHSIIFQPERGLVWVSTAPWQSGPFVCYNVFEIFHKFAALQQPVEVDLAKPGIPADPFLGSQDYHKFLRYQTLKKLLKQAIKSGDAAGLPVSVINEFRNTNPNYYEVHDLTGDYYTLLGDPVKANEAYDQALRMEIPRWNEKVRILKKLK